MNNSESYFAPPERLDDDELYSQTIKVLGLRKVLPILEILPNMIVILNEQRQVVYANKSFLKSIGAENFQEALGQRPGELINCIYSQETKFGCGTAESCCYCGAVLTVLKTQETKTRQENDAKITVKNNGKDKVLDLHVISAPLEVDKNVFYFTVMTNNG